MLYILGDSFSFGWNFWKAKQNREELIYGYHLSKKLNEQLCNLSIPGGSNWRIARLIASLNLTKDDTVIVAWSGNNRSEIGCSKDDFSPIDRFFNTYGDKIFNSYLEEPADFFQYVEKTNNIYTRRLFSSLFTSSIRPGTPTKVTNHAFKKFFDNLYAQFYSDEWYDEMFRVMFMSTVYKLKISECNFLLFNTYSNNYPTVAEEFKLKEYLYGPCHNMTCQIRSLKEIDYKNIKYWDANEHVQIADLLYKNLTENNLK